MKSYFVVYFLYLKQKHIDHNCEYNSPDGNGNPFWIGKLLFRQVYPKGLECTAG